jgi:hypothetical protein
MTGALHLSQLAAPYVLLLGYSRECFPPGMRDDAFRTGPRALNKIEFRYLNGNLMFPEIHPLTLVFECNSRKADTSLHLVSSNEWYWHQPFGFTFLPSIGR